MNNSRRTFMKTLILGAGAIVIAPVLKIKDVLAALVDEKKDPTAQALGYVSHVDKDKKAPSLKDRKDKKAYCKSCQFYGDPTGKAPQAKCQLITSGDVLATGWCRSYSKRA